MPIMIDTFLVAALTGLWLARRATLAVAALDVVTSAALARAASDGKGTDPWWLVSVAAAACGFALSLVAFLPGRRLREVAA
jgi:hypothetical protein